MLDPRKNHKIHPYGKLVVAALALSVMGIAFGASTWPQLPELLSSVSSAGGHEHGDPRDS